MKKISIGIFFATACQANMEETSLVEQDVEHNTVQIQDVVDAPESQTSSVLSLPNQLQCASSPVHYDYTGVPLVIRFDIQNVYGQAYVSFTMGALHSDISYENIGSAQVQVPVVLSEESIAIEIPAGAATVEGYGAVRQGLLADRVSIHLSPEGNGDYLGILQSFAFFDVPIHCWEPDMPRVFHYNHETGICEDEDGIEGFNPAYPIKVRETGDAHCMDLQDWLLAGAIFSAHPWFSNDSNLVWDLRGARLEGAELYNANLVDSDFSGSDLRGLLFENSRLQGLSDDHTLLPEDCVAIDQEINCQR